MRLPGGSRSRAVLMGTSIAADPDLPALPEVRAEVADLAAALADGGIRCSVLVDQTARFVNEGLESAASQAEDLLLVHYAGHGLLDHRGRLFLAVPDTRRELVRWTAVPFRDVRDVLLDAPARYRVLVLDCRFDAQALAALGDPHSVLTEQLTIRGVPALIATDVEKPVGLTRLLVEALRTARPDDRVSGVYRAMVRLSGPTRTWQVKG